MNNLYFNFYGVWVQVTSSQEELLRRSELDFSHFYAAHCPMEMAHYRFYGEKSPPPWGEIPSTSALFQSVNSMTYEEGRTRFNDYYGKALTIYDYQNESGRVYSEDLEKLHELLYLMILSRVGKKLDMKGLHRIHAFGIIKNQTALLGVMPMKGGKSTHFLQFIKDPKVHVLSDDIPLVSRWGRVHPFPMRVGFDGPRDNILSMVQDPASVYQLHREHYGRKTLISMRGIANSVGGDYRKLIIFQGVRCRFSGCRIKPVSKWALLWTLIKFQVIGLGLPMILEYFWETGFRDFLRKSFIAISRFWAVILLLSRAKTYTVVLGIDPEKNVQAMNEVFFGDVPIPKSKE